MSLSEILAKPAVQIAVAIVLPSVGGFVLNSFGGSGFPDNDKWFEGLKFPSFRPPNWVFPPVWATLYSSMGYASYVIYKQGGGFNGPARIPLILYGSQLALNWAFIPVFTGVKNLKLVRIRRNLLLYHDFNVYLNRAQYIWLESLLLLLQLLSHSTV